MNDKPKLICIIEAFEKVQDELTKWGSADSEPTWAFEALMRKALNGEKWPEPQPEYWELYSSVPGWKRAANRLTAAAKRAFKRVQKAPVVEALELGKWCGWSR